MNVWTCSGRQSKFKQCFAQTNSTRMLVLLTYKAGYAIWLLHKNNAFPSKWVSGYIISPPFCFDLTKPDLSKTFGLIGTFSLVWQPWVLAGPVVCSPLFVCVLPCRFQVGGVNATGNTWVVSHEHLRCGSHSRSSFSSSSSSSSSSFSAWHRPRY